ncbi:MAG: inositol monophosphatase family protein [Actinomycetota bacterium]
MIGAEVESPASHLEHVAIEVARMAADLVRPGVGVARIAGTKSTPTDVVTDHDLRSEALIRSELVARCPGSSIMGEEYGDRAGVNGISWIVDPIDGTVNFLYGLPVVSTSIAARIDGVVVAGAVADVRTGHTFSASLGDGARLDGVGLRASEVASLDQALIGTGFGYAAEVRAAQASVLVELLPRCRDIRTMGSAALNLCWVGAGRLDAYFERDLKPYDYAAGALVAAEAGAVVSLPTDGSDLTVAASPRIAGAVGELVGRDR